MATSTFYTPLIIDDKAADIIIKGLNAPKKPLPVVSREVYEEGERLIRLFRLNLKKQSGNPNKQE